MTPRVLLWLTMLSLSWHGLFFLLFFLLNNDSSDSQILCSQEANPSLQIWYSLYVLNCLYVGQNTFDEYYSIKIFYIDFSPTPWTNLVRERQSSQIYLYSRFSETQIQSALQDRNITQSPIMKQAINITFSQMLSSSKCTNMLINFPFTTNQRQL